MSEAIEASRRSRSGGRHPGHAPRVQPDWSGVNDDHLPRQLIPVRLAHLESPHSYLRRVCVANSIDPAWMTKMVGHRRQQRGTGAAELGSVIEELSGVSPIVFERAHSHARLGHATTRGTWDRQRVISRRLHSLHGGHKGRHVSAHSIPLLQTPQALALAMYNDQSSSHHAARQMASKATRASDRRLRRVGSCCRTGFKLRWNCRRDLWVAPAASIHDLLDRRLDRTSDSALSRSVSVARAIAQLATSPPVTTPTSTPAQLG